jgi:hypothetical protein
MKAQIPSAHAQSRDRKILVNTQFSISFLSVALCLIIHVFLRRIIESSSAYEGVSKSFRTGRLERELEWYSCHWMQLYRCFVSQSSEFCRHKPLCCFSTNVYYYCLFCYLLSLENF